MSTSGYGDILPHRVGAIEPYAFELSRYLSISNTVHFLGKGTGSQKIGNLSVETFSYKKNLPLFLKHFLGDRLAFQIPYSIYLFKDFSKLNKKQHIDILHLHDANSGFIGDAIGKVFGTPWVCSIHNEIKNAISLQNCGKILAVSNYIRDFLVYERKVNPKKIEILNIAIDTCFFSRKINIEVAKKILNINDRRVILFVGRKCPEKGPKIIIEALPKIINNYPNILAIFIGPDYFFGNNSNSYTNFLKKIANELRVEDNILFIDYISQNKLDIFFQAADIVVFPSIWQEPFGKVIIEAMSYEIPVVASAVGAVPEIIINKKNGLLFKNKDPDSLANSIIHILKEPEFARLLKEEGRLTVLRKYTFEKVSKKCLEIYNRILINNS